MGISIIGVLIYIFRGFPAELPQTVKGIRMEFPVGSIIFLNRLLTFRCGEKIAGNFFINGCGHMADDVGPGHGDTTSQSEVFLL